MESHRQTIRIIEGGIEMTEEENLSEEAQRVMMWDNTDSGIIHSVHAYLMWHSGAVLRNAITDREERSIYLDFQAENAEEWAREHGYDMSDRRRIESITSLDSQTQHDFGEQPICYLDVELIEAGCAVPVLAPTGFTLEPLQAGFPRFTSYEDFRQAYIQLGYYIKHITSEVDYHFQRLQKVYLQIANYSFRQVVDSFHFVPPEFHIIGLPCDRRRTISQLNGAYDIGQLVSIRGQIIEISEVKTTYPVIAWKCKDTNCREVHFVEQEAIGGAIEKPIPTCGKWVEMLTGESNGCNSKHFIRMAPPMSQSISLQRMTLQEEELTNGEARTITVEIRGSLTDAMIAGQGVEIVGVLLTEAVTKGANLENKFILAKSVTEKTDVVSTVQVTEEEEMQVRRFVDSLNYKERMSLITKSWGGRVFSENHIKEAIILQSIGGVYNNYSETRGTINLLLVGDPGTAKTKLLQLATKLHPGSRFAQADATSQAGLIAACQPKEDMYTGKRKWALTPGVLALTHKDAICSIDEFNLYKGDYGEFQNAMETGEVFINKVVKGKVITDAPVLAGANPNNGNKKKWIRGERVPYTEQIGLDFPMLQRFTMILILEDTPDFERDKNISMAMTKGISKTKSKDAEEDSELLDMIFIQKYLAIARTQTPLLTKEAQEYMANNHATKRQESQDDPDGLRSHRQENSLWRLASAVAKFDLSEEISLKHMRVAEELLAESLEEKDPGLFTTGATKADRELEVAVREGIITFFHDHDSDDAKTLADIHAKVSESISGWRKPSLNEFEAILDSVADMTEGIEKLGDQYYKL